MLLPVVLAGGVGARLWPLSRAALPKPFMYLLDGQNLIQKTYLRTLALDHVREILTVTNRALFFHARDAFDAVIPGQIHHSLLLEPAGRGSAAAIALAAQYAIRNYSADCILLVLPADHLVDDLTAFAEAVQQAITLAQDGKLVTFGVKARGPETKFGYIKASGNHVEQFVEKPDFHRAKAYVESGSFFWNCGMFCMTAAAFQSELEAYCPDIAAGACRSFHNASCATGPGWHQAEIGRDDFELIPNISVDYAIFEKSKNVAMVPCDAGWTDIGSWTEFGALLPADDAQNNIAGKAIVEDTRDCIIYGNSPGGQKLIAALGIENLIISDTADALLIARKDLAQHVPKIVDRLKMRQDSCYQEFPTAHRPWGTYTVLLEGPGYKLKQLEVKPGGCLSLQSHRLRSEHWVVVRGVATVTHDDRCVTLQRDQSTYIPAGDKHRLENRGTDLLTIIEVQCGSYVGEDDIIRYTDRYGR